MDLKSNADLLPVQEKESREAVIRINLPSSLNPSVSLPNGFFQWFVLVTCSYGMKKASAQIPVVVQPPVPVFLKNFPSQARLGVSDVGPLPAHLELRPDISSLPWWALLPPSN
jgi:hypothetical protein